MHEQASPPTPPSASKPKKPLDTVVKLALSVFVGSFALIWGGMYLSRPDRSIPPCSIGSQEGVSVAVHVPYYTSDTEIEALIERFRKVGRETRNFGPMKIRRPPQTILKDDTGASPSTSSHTRTGRKRTFSISF